MELNTACNCLLQDRFSANELVQVSEHTQRHTHWSGYLLVLLAN